MTKQKFRDEGVAETHLASLNSRAGPDIAPIDSAAFEKKFWPLKILSSGIRTYLIPIRPNWAMNLFDRRLAERDLFDPDALRYFNLENVYYRSAFHRNIRWPSRILWYVSKGSEKTQIEVGAVKACSILKSIDVGLPKETFTKYRRLGIYSWREVLGTTGGDLWKNVMAILFSHTEYFDAAVPLNFIMACASMRLGFGVQFDHLAKSLTSSLR